MMQLKASYINMNCDVGEGIGNEAALLPLISSCNIACGGHAGDTQSMRKVVALAKMHQVKVGAHPSYPDPENFGRTSMAMPKDALKQSIQEQIQALYIILEEEKMPLHHIKPHGALYNDAAKDPKIAAIILDAIAPYKKEVVLYAPYGSVIAKSAIAANYKVMYEAFGDRNYNSDLSLVSRSLDKALIQDPETVLQHLLNMHLHKKLTTVDGQEVAIQADTYCVHGDTPTALEILMYLSTELPKHQIQLKK